MKKLALIGFGEAAQALLPGFAPFVNGVWDKKLSDPKSEIHGVVAHAGLEPSASMADAVANADWVISLVTADQAKAACEEAAPHMKTGALYLECNSCSPGTKRHNAEVVKEVGAELIDIAIMSPVDPARLKTPLLLSGPQAQLIAEQLAALGYNAKVFGPEVGQASAVKMTRSVMIKGLEALSAECFLTAQKLGLGEEIVASLNASFPEFDWYKTGGYNLERMAQHGLRRAAEMREVAVTLSEAGVPNDMVKATVKWQQRMGDLAMGSPSDDLNEIATQVLQRI